MCVITFAITGTFTFFGHFDVYRILEKKMLQVFAFQMVRWYGCSFTNINEQSGAMLGLFPLILPDVVRQCASCSFGS